MGTGEAEMRARAIAAAAIALAWQLSGISPSPASADHETRFTGPAVFSWDLIVGVAVASTLSLAALFAVAWLFWKRDGQRERARVAAQDRRREAGQP